MALITQELLENHEEFKTIAQTQQYTIGATNLVNQARTFQQSDMMFYEGNDYYYPKTIAGKPVIQMKHSTHWYPVQRMIIWS